MKNKNGFQKIIIVIVSVFIFILFVFALSYVYERFFNSNNIDTQIIGGDKDEGGCLIAAGYSWCEEKQKCLRTWEELCIEEAPEIVEEDSVSVVDELKKLFSEKYNIDASNITITISNIQDQFFRGGVKLSLDEEATGGLFLAKAVDDKYVLVFDGNGQIDCALVSDFPENMIDDCVE